MSEKTKQNNTKMNKQNRSNKRSRRKEKKKKQTKKQKQKNDKHLNTHLIFWYYVELKDSRHLSTQFLNLF